MRVRKSNKIFTYLLAIFLIFSSIVFNYAQNKTIEKETNKNSIKQLDQEGQNYRLVTSADNVQVPVPKGYVASSVTGENYVTPEYRHTQIPHKGNYTELTWSSPAGEQYPWTQDENGIWISGNKGIKWSTSTLESEEFDYIKGTTLTINYTYSCQNSYYSDYLSIYLIDLTNNKTTTIVSKKYGNTGTSFNYLASNYTYTMNDWGTGRYKIQAIYSKDYSTDGGQDSGYIKTSTYFKEDENGTDTIEEDIKTKIHDGGFVIYELTDAELETDPNGTGIIINDTNKDIAQSTRNQYVWVPVENVEDLVRTKTINNGIMQFGQGYEFSNISITKETYTGTDYFREPRLLRYDKTKYRLQRYSIIEKRESYLNNQQEEFTRMIKSINKYKGFYIGRYETGDDYTRDYSTSFRSFVNPKVVRYNSNINYVTWYSSYDDAKRLAGNKGKYVKTGMIFDTMWDYTLKWLNETETRSYEEINKDSGKWGNYTNINLKYKSSANGTESTQNAYSYRRTPTGGITQIIYKGETYSDSPTSSNNIFDIAGNVMEWTASCYSISDRQLRGGAYDIHSYTSNFMASGRSNSAQSNSDSNYGLRSLLCIN